MPNNSDIVLPCAISISNKLNVRQYKERDHGNDLATAQIDILVNCACSD